MESNFPSIFSKRLDWIKVMLWAPLFSAFFLAHSIASGLMSVARTELEGLVLAFRMETRPEPVPISRISPFRLREWNARSSESSAGS